MALLEQLDKLTSRKDQVREPVAGDEILAVVKRRLLGAEPPEDAAREVAARYAEAVGTLWRARAETPADKQIADEQTVQLRKRLQAAYPFHPMLIDVMNGRWTSVDGFQRTRGALRFLATCLHALKKSGGARAILGPAEIPIGDAEVRRAMLKDLDPGQDYAPVITHDLVGPNARAKRIDDRRAQESPGLAHVRPALRLATAILAYSFGGLRRGEGNDTLPPGVSETELLSACVGPDLDTVTASAVLADLRNSCLYLHYDGARYCFKKDPNVTKLIEDTEQELARDPDAVRQRIKEMLQSRLAGTRAAIVWPTAPHEVPDREPRFLVAYLPLEFAVQPPREQDATAIALLSQYGDTLRQYRNGIALAIPDRKVIEALRRAVRYLMAVERVDARKREHRLTKEQEQQLKERRRTEEAAAETAFRQLYSAVWLPRVAGGGTLDLEKLELGGRPLQATGIHERVMEFLTTVGTPKIHGTLHPRKIVERMKLGEPLVPGEPPRIGVTAKDVRDAFFAFLEPPRIVSDDVLRQAIARGVREKMFGYTTGTPELGRDGTYRVARQKVAFGCEISDDEVDFEVGFLIMPEAIPVAVCPKCGKTPCQCPPPEVCPKCGKMPCQCPPAVCPKCGKTPCQCPPDGVCPKCGKRPCVCPKARTRVTIRMRATREQVFKSFGAIANLADKSEDGKVRIVVEGEQPEGYDANWFRNAVQEPLDEANIDELQIE